MPLAFLYFCIIHVDDLVAQAISYHISSRDSIQTLACNAEYSYTLINTKQKEAINQRFFANYLQTPGIVKVTRIESTEKVISLWKDKVKSSSITRYVDGREFHSTTKVNSKNMHSDRADAFIRGLLLFNIPGSSEHITLEELHSKAKSAVAKWVTIDGKRMIELDMEMNTALPEKLRSTIIIYLDASVNYLVRKVEYRNKSDEGNLTKTYQVVEFNEHRGGIFFPKEVTSYLTESFGAEGTSRTIFDKVKVNEVIHSSAFDLSIPKNAIMADNTTGTAYKIDSAGNRVSEKVALSRNPLPASIADMEITNKQQSSSPKYAYYVILAASILTIVAAWYIAKVRRKHDLQ